MLRPEKTAQRINAIVNHPSVYPWIRGAETKPIDLTKVVENKDNVVLVGEHGGIVFNKIQPGIYECHTSVLPSGRGAWVKENSARVLSWMFLNTDAVEVITRCPRSNPASIMGARLCGFVKYFTTGKIWPHNGGMVEMDVFGVRIEHWVNDAKDLIKQGQMFHQMLEDEYKRMGKTISVHAEDETHDRFVGAASYMLNAGLVWKAVNFYNRWARMSGYQPISVVSDDPLIIDISDARLKISYNKFEVI